MKLNELYTKDKVNLAGVIIIILITLGLLIYHYLIIA